jgi:hypothetical protein
MTTRHYLFRGATVSEMDRQELNRLTVVGEINPGAIAQAAVLPDIEDLRRAGARVDHRGRDAPGMCWSRSMKRT